MLKNLDFFDKKISFVFTLFLLNLNEKFKNKFHLIIYFNLTNIIICFNLIYFFHDKILYLLFVYIKSNNHVLELF